MQQILRRVLTSIGLSTIIFVNLQAQSFNFNCTRDTVLLGCVPTACITLKGIIPDLRGISSSYSINPTNTTTGCFPVYVQPNDPLGAPTNLTIDDRYSSVINIGFSFLFYGISYNSLIASTNGFLSFDISKAGLFAHWNAISGVTPQNLPNTFYDRALIMGPYHDLDPSVSTSPTQRVQYQSVGTAPHRKWILSFFKVPLFFTTCNSLIENTHQIVLYESTGIIEVIIFSKQICTGWNQGRGIVGLQNFNRDDGIMAPGRSATDPPWGSIGMNESWRFVPAGGPSLLIRVELYDISGNLITVGNTVDLGNGQLEASFPSICAPAGVITPYIIKSVYEKIDDPLIEVYGTDTIRIDRTNSVLSANATSTATFCNTSVNGTITITNANGASPYTFILNGGTPQTGNISFTFNNVPAGNHVVVVTEASGCTASIPVAVAAGPPYATTVNKTDVLCKSGNSGSITVVQPLSGTAPFEYSVNRTTWQIGNIFSGLTAGTYTVYYRESSGCQGSQQVLINEPAAIAASLTTIPAVCNGQNNGTITVNASGGTAPFQYSFNGSPFQSNNTFNGVAGIYSVTIRDNNNCTTTQNITVTEPGILTLIPAQSNATCDGGNNGTITISASGGNSNYQYSLDGIGFQSLNLFNVAPGSYVVTVKDNLDCKASQNVIVGLSNNLTMIPQMDKTICEGNTTQLQFTSNASLYSWSPASGLSNTTIKNPLANPVVTTQYIVTATLGRCSVSNSVIVNVNPAPLPGAGMDGFICYGQSYSLQGSGGVLFNWSPGSTLSSQTMAHPIATPEKTITYTLSVIDANGCQSLVTDDVVIDVTPPIVVSTFPKDTIVYQGDQFRILATSAANMYTWSPSLGLSNSGLQDPIVNAGAIGEIVLYKVTASTIAGCKGEGTVKVQVYKGPDIYIPTGFTPNGDGKNDRFKPFPVGVKQIIYFKVFNRWGKQLFSTSTHNDGWDGRFGEVNQPIGTYVWIVQGITKTGKLITKKGTVTLIR